ncbi:MAG TPA: hypothetical protein VFF75_03975 [Methylophilaceae bacterium]|nr:hypothetical protein [Methylophilaceae bacterium]
MSSVTKHGVTAGSPENTPVSYTISGFFRDEAAIHAVLHGCVRRGVPRDLIDVAVSEAAAPKFYGGRARPNRDSWFSWTGRGALAGLIISAIISLVIIMIPGFNMSEMMAIVQFLGPDIGVIAGAFLGAVYGWLKPGDIRPQFQRANLRSDAMLMLVHLQPEEEARELQEIFRSQGAEDVVMEPDMATSVGAE